VVKPSEYQDEKFFGQWIGSSAISLEIVDGGVLENVVVSDISVTGTESPVFVRLGNRGRGYKEGQVISQVGRIRGVCINNVFVRDAGAMGCSVTGLPGHPVEDVTIANVVLCHKGGVTASDMADIEKAVADEKEKEYPEATMWGNLPAKGFYVRHARNVVFRNVSVVTETADVRPDFVKVDVE
jgi:hypothetical protein